MKNRQLRAGGVEHIGEIRRRTVAEQQHRTTAIRTKIMAQDTYCIERCRAGIIAAVYTSENSIRQILIIQSNGRINTDARQTVQRRLLIFHKRKLHFLQRDGFKMDDPVWKALPGPAAEAGRGSTAGQRTGR